MRILEVTERNFEAEVLQARLPVVVDFYAPWCGPCKVLAPLLEQAAAELEGRISITKLNVDNAPGLAANYEVGGVPTLALFRHGELVDRIVGFGGPKALTAWLIKAAFGVAPSVEPTVKASGV